MWGRDGQETEPTNALPDASHIEGAGDGPWHDTPMEIEIERVWRGEEVLAAESEGGSLLIAAEAVLVEKTDLAECTPRRQEIFRRDDDIEVMKERSAQLP